MSYLVGVDIYLSLVGSIGGGPNRTMMSVEPLSMQRAIEMLRLPMRNFDDETEWSRRL